MAGFCFYRGGSLPVEPAEKRVVAFIDGIDVRIALDVVRLAREGCYDVALLFSQDQDLSEVADEVRKISSTQKRWIKVVSAFPTSPTALNRRGINNTEWIRIDRATYDACLDPNDYRPKTQRK
ncbi:MAG: NYN domain-containing protein [Deltaproteobacteria bacterium]|nr:NYN domain-containing protein [Deltaproteobacteria bacterium]MBI4373912.1 NYN domain-containing protein [Deltaproteobacteria bacterium]